MDAAPGVPGEKPNTAQKKGPLIYRQSAWTRGTHWLWAISLFFLLLSGLQIFNAHPALYIGDQSGFQFENHVLAIYSEQGDSGRVGVTEVFGQKFDTTGVLGVSDSRARAFPSWATVPSGQNLATGRVIHFFFAWVLVGTLIVWLVASLINRHLQRDLVPTLGDLKKLPRDMIDHARLRFHHVREYNTLQKLAYAGVLFVLLPVMILTGLCMSPGANAAMPWLPDLFGGRQTARTIHFVAMLLLVGFFLVHMLMILAAGPLNELRSIITGWYRTDAPATSTDKKEA
ncbi:MAG: cytochrome b/b6 domain-containing protein [Rhizobiaceae bacterium]